jgi:hypothetical protein
VLRGAAVVISGGEPWHRFFADPVIAFYLLTIFSIYLCLDDGKGGRGVLQRYDEQQRFTKRLRGAWAGFWETTSYICVSLALLIAYVEYAAHNDKQQLDTAWEIYREIDHVYIEFVKVCVDHPRLDCYSLPAKSPAALTPEESVQQRVLYDMLTDVFEVAYFHLIKFKENISSQAAQKMLLDQWDGWDSYMAKFLIRPAYMSTWLDIEEGYDDGLRCHIRSLVIKIKNNRDSVVNDFDPSLRERLDRWLSSLDKKCTTQVEQAPSPCSSASCVLQRLRTRIVSLVKV